MKALLILEVKMPNGITTFPISTQVIPPVNTSIIVSTGNGQTIYESFPGHKGRPGKEGGSSPKTGTGIIDYAKAAIKGLKRKMGIYDKPGMDQEALDAYVAGVNAAKEKIASSNKSPNLSQLVDKYTPDYRGGSTQNFQNMLKEIYRVGPLSLEKAMTVTKWKGTKNDFIRELNDHGFTSAGGKVRVYLDTYPGAKDVALMRRQDTKAKQWKNKKT